ncbi:hypothetical protein BRC81_15835 [Halobacteriales archaeon QS_1_68_20]|nr:MAG: hypothetical protein BRC81_15835 [Halobacteriales archaeon QS_1_68_20]
MTGSLVVHLNRGSLHEVRPETDVFETTGSFEVELRNHGQAVHVHLRLDDSLDAVASLPEPNHFVDTDDAEVVRVQVEGDRTVRGTLSVVGGYGNTEAGVEVVVGDTGDDQSVDVRKSLGRPQPRSADSGLTVDAFDPATLRVAGLAVLALVLAVVAVVAAPSVVVVLGALTVLVGVAVAGYLLTG